LFTAPQVGNYPILSERLQSTHIRPKAVLALDMDFETENGLGQWLMKQNVPILHSLPTREIALFVRTHGCPPGVIHNNAPTNELNETANQVTKLFEHSVFDAVSSSELHSQKPATRAQDLGLPICAIDYGIKAGILNSLKKAGFAVTVVSHKTSARDVMSGDYRGLFLSNGPGDPATAHKETGVIRELLGKLPIFGICMGHQLLAQAVGAKTKKLAFGHRGANHPVHNLKTKDVWITSHNHGYAVDFQSFPEHLRASGAVFQSYVDLNDSCCEGIEYPHLSAFSVQFHPEACPGTHEARALFTDFYQRVLDFPNRKAL
jgi:carbamoyl-phosphate synthase small subunit